MRSRVLEAEESDMVELTTKGMSSIAIRVGASARDGRAGEAEKWMKSEVKLEPELSPTRDPLSQ